MFVRFRTQTGEQNIIASNIVSFAPSKTVDGTDVRLVTGDYLTLEGISCQSIRGALKKLTKVEESAEG